VAPAPLLLSPFLLGLTLFPSCFIPFPRLALTPPFPHNSFVRRYPLLVADFRQQPFPYTFVYPRFNPQPPSHTPDPRPWNLIGDNAPRNLRHRYTVTHAASEFSKPFAAGLPFLNKESPPLPRPTPPFPLLKDLRNSPHCFSYCY